MILGARRTLCWQSWSIWCSDDQSLFDQYVEPWKAWALGGQKRPGAEDFVGGIRYLSSNFAKSQALWEEVTETDGDKDEGVVSRIEESSWSAAAVIKTVRDIALVGAGAFVINEAYKGLNSYFGSTEE